MKVPALVNFVDGVLTDPAMLYAVDTSVEAMEPARNYLLSFMRLSIMSLTNVPALVDHAACSFRQQTHVLKFHDDGIHLAACIG